MLSEYVNRLLESEEFQKYARLLPKNFEHFPDCVVGPDDYGCVCLEELYFISDRVFGPLPQPLSQWGFKKEWEAYRAEKEKRGEAVSVAFHKINRS